jgi:hypothetical protein
MLAEMLVQEGMRQIIIIITLYNILMLRDKSGALTKIWTRDPLIKLLGST